MPKSKAERLTERRHRIARERRYEKRINNFRVGDLVCAYGHGIIVEIDNLDELGVKYNDRSRKDFVGYASVWHAGVFKVEKEYRNKWGVWCCHCGYQNKDEIIQLVQKWCVDNPPYLIPRWSSKADYKTKRAHLLFCLVYARCAPDWVRKSFQRDLVRLRAENRVESIKHLDKQRATIGLREVPYEEAAEIIRNARDGKLMKKEL